MVPPSVSLKLQLLGPATLLSALGPVSFPADKRHQLLAYLACRGEWVGRERLADIFYPDLPSDAARANLRRLLQRVHELPWLTDLEVERSRIRWSPATDLADFWAATEAGNVQQVLDLYRGPLLQGIDSYEDGEFATWLMAERERAHGRWREAVLAVAQEKPAAEAASLYARLLEQDEFDEEALGLRLATLSRSGRQQEALRVYRAFADKLKRELGLEPSSATWQLVEAIEQSQVPLMPGPIEKPAATPPAEMKVFLPAPATSFVGRDFELGEVASRLTQPDCRLLTVLGPGGVGKTRLVLQSAKELARLFPDGRHFVALDGLRTPEAMPAAIADAVGVRLQGADEPLDQVARSVVEDERLLVLDNFEHLVEGAGMLAVLLERCPNLRLLVTSRVRLDLDDEWLLPLEGMAFPSADVDAREVTTYDAVRLFTERAQRVQPSFAFSGADTGAVLKICRLVHGSPLGIELAAAWVRALPVGEIAGEVESSLDFLNSSARGVSDRHRSVRATFEYSWRLLTNSERDALAKLSVFRGGFTREAAALVAGANLALLVALVDKSLLVAGPEGRYDFHPLVQQYAGEKLAEDPGEEQQARAKHAECFTIVGETAEGALRGAQQAAWLRRLDDEHDNLREALRWCQGAGLAETGLRLAASLWSFWWIRGHWAEGREWLAAFLARSSGAVSVLRARALKALGNLEEDLGDYETARSAFEECLAIYRALEDEAGAATALHGLGRISEIRGRSEAAEAYFLETLAVERKLDNRLRVAESLTNLGIVYTNRGDHNAVQGVYEEALKIGRELDNRFLVVNLLNDLGLVAWHLGAYDLAAERLKECLSLSTEPSFEAPVTLALSNLGMVALDQGDIPGALGYAREALDRRREHRDRQGLAYSLENLADIAAASGDPERAARLWGAAEALREELGAPLPPSWRPRRERFVSRARSQLEQAAFAAAWGEGRAMALERAVRHAAETTV